MVNTGPTAMLVDDAVIRPSKPPEGTCGVTTDGGQRFTAEDLANGDDARAILRAPRGPHDPPPNDARRSFDAWKKRKAGGLEP